MNWDGYQLYLPLLDDDDEGPSKRVLQFIRKPSFRGVGSGPATSASMRQPITRKPLPKTTTVKPLRPPLTTTQKPPIIKPPSRPTTKPPSRPATSTNTTRPTTTPSTTITSKIVTRPRSAAAVPKVGSSTKPTTSSSVKGPATSASTRRPTEVDKFMVTRNGARTIVPDHPSVKTRPRTVNGTGVNSSSVVTQKTATTIMSKVKMGPIPKGVGAKSTGVVKSEGSGLAVVKGVDEKEQGGEEKKKDKEKESSSGKEVEKVFNLK